MAKKCKSKSTCTHVLSCHQPQLLPSSSELAKRELNTIITPKIVESLTLESAFRGQQLRYTASCASTHKPFCGPPQDLPVHGVSDAQSNGTTACGTPACPAADEFFPLKLYSMTMSQVARVALVGRAGQLACAGETWDCHNFAHHLAFVEGLMRAVNPHHCPLACNLQAATDPGNPLSQTDALCWMGCLSSRQQA